MSGGLGAKKPPRRVGGKGGEDSLPGSSQKNTYTKVDVTYTAVTSPHSRGLRHNHAWHGGERAHYYSIPPSYTNRIYSKHL